MIQLLLPLITAIAGGIVGLLESRSATRVERQRLENERERDAILGAQNQIEAFYKSHQRNDEAKRFKISILGIRYEGYRYLPIPSRVYQFHVMFLLTAAYCFVVCIAAIAADIPIWSFPAAPDQYSWLNIFGLSLVEGTKTSVYQLTLGGILLPLLSPFFFAFTRYVTGVSPNRI